MSTSPDQPSTPAGSHFQPSLPVVVIILVLFVCTAFLIERSTTPTHATAGPVTTTTHATAHPGTSTTTTLKPVQIPRAQVSVQVANGTSIKGFAKTVTQQLQTLGWNTLSAINGPHETSTIVYYKPAFRWAAITIAGELRVPVTAIHVLTSLPSVAGSSGDDIVVVLGPNAH